MELTARALRNAFVVGRTGVTTAARVEGDPCCSAARFGIAGSETRSVWQSDVQRNTVQR